MDQQPDSTPADASDAAASPTSGRWRAASRFIALLLAVFVAKQIFFVAASYPFSGHDELAHYSYIRTLVTEARIPVLPDLEAWRAQLDGGDPPPADNIPEELYEYCRFTLDWYCEPDNPRWRNSPPRIVFVPGMGNFPSGYQYVANHPPLYYAAMAPLFAASAAWSPLQQHYLLRLAAIPLGMVVVYAAYRMSRALFPGDAFLTVTVPAFVAFQPQISYEAAMVNNDIAAIAATSLLLWQLVVGVRDRFPMRLCAIVGVTFGLGLLAKGTTITMAPVIALAVILAVGWRDVRGWVGRGALILALAAVISGPWYLFLRQTYGDFSGLARVEELQWWNGPMGGFLELLRDPDFVVGRFRETWGEFGWRLIHLSTPLLWAIAVPIIAALVGIALYAAASARDIPSLRRFATPRPERWQMVALVVLAAACLIAYLAVIQFGTTFALAQARYYFPIVNAAALLLMVGLRALIPGRYRPAGQAVVVCALIALNVLIMTAYFLPFTVTYGEPLFPWSWGG